MSLIMEEGTRTEWGCDRDYYSWSTSSVNQSFGFNEGFFGFGSNASDLVDLNDMLFDGVEFLSSLSRTEPSFSADLVSDDLILDCPKKELVSDDLILDCPKKELVSDDLILDCPKKELVSDDLIYDFPNGGEDLMVYDEMFSDFSSAPSDSESPCSTTVELCSMEEDLMDAMLNECEGLRMESSNEDGRDGVSVESQKCSDELSQDWSAGNKSVNTSVSVGFDWASLVPCSNGNDTDSEEYRGLRLVHFLTACADAISEGAHDAVEIILARLRKLVSPTGSTMQRVAFYLSQSLHQYHHHQKWGSSNNVTKDANYMGALSLLNQAYPYIRFAHFTANQSILEAIPAQGHKVHIIDFDIMEGMQWPPLMEALKNENYNIAHLKITALRWEDDEEDNEGDDSCLPKETGRRLCEHASSVGIPFSFQETQLENMKKRMDWEEDEIVIVNCMWGLPHMLGRGREELMEFIDGVRKLNPAVVTMGTGPNSMGAHEKLNFSERFGECMRNMCAVLDSVEAGLPAQYDLARAMVERLFMAPLMCTPITSLSQEVPLPCVVDTLLQSGFAECDISSKNALYATYMVKDQNEYRVLKAGTNQLLLLWQSTPLTWVSTWTQSRNFR